MLILIIALVAFIALLWFRESLIGKLFLSLSLTVLIVSSIVWIGNLTSKEREYENALYEKSVLEYRLENSELAGNELLYQDIVTFNNKLRTEKMYCDSIWIGIFFNEKLATIDYVEISK